MHCKSMTAIPNFARHPFVAGPKATARQSQLNWRHRPDAIPGAAARGRYCGRVGGPSAAALFTLVICLAGLMAGPLPAAADSPARQPGPAAMARRDRLPRKVLVGTMVSGYAVLSRPLEQRLQKMDEVVGAIAARAGSDYPGKQLDLVVLPEFFLARPGDSLAQKVVRLEEVEPRIAACARRHHCYLVVPMLLQEADSPPRYSNVAVLVDREGRVAGMYRKVHPVAPQGSDVLEEGTTPGRLFPVFDCDFGRVGIQICFDMMYTDGWQALADQGAEIVALASADPDVVHPAAYAMQHKYYIVSATPRDHAAVIGPLGIIEAQLSQEDTVLVHQIDLSYALLHWDAVLEEGEALSRKFGSKVGFHYYRPADMGIFWSNDPAMTIGQMIRSLGLSETDAELERIRLLQDKARGGPPAVP
jgi:predicted amidohydrolase